MNEDNQASQSDDNSEEPSATIATVDSVDGGGIAPDRRLTLSANRLAGSPACLNCGIDLKGPFCYYCGQPDRNFMRFFPVLLREFLEDFLELDSRFTRTMKPLLFKPGRLTRDYLEGRRFRYTPPLRLYLFSSIAFFLLAAMLSSSAFNPDDFKTSKAPDNVVRITTNSEEEAREVAEVLKRLPAGIRDQIALEDGNVITVEENEDENWFDSGDIQFNDEPWDRQTNPVDIPWTPDWFNNWINKEIERSPEKADQISQNPRLIVEQIFDLLPGTIFVLLPVVALIFKFWYLFAKRFYIEHLILALHNHSFIFVCLILAFLLGLVEEYFVANGMGTGERIASWTNVAIFIWIPVYLLFSLRRVYQQNWFLTIGKYGLIGFSYLILLGIVTGFVAVLGFLLL